METAAITLRWKIDDVKQKFKERTRVDSPAFDGDRWYLHLAFDQAKGLAEGEQFCELYLYLMPTPEESVEGAIWARDMEWRYSIETTKGKVLKSAILLKRFESGSDIDWNWGDSELLSAKALREALAADGSDQLIISFTLCTRDQQHQPPNLFQTVTHDSLCNLFEDSTTDVVIRIRPAGDEESERCLYAHKGVLEGHSTYFTNLFNSGFSESEKIVKYADVAKSSTLQEEEDDDDSTEWLDDQSEEGQQAEPQVESETSASGPAGSATTSAGAAGRTSARSVHSAPAGQAEVSVEERFKERNLREVIVVDAGWSTYRALLYWMYTHRLRLTEPHSNYLVHLDSLNSVIKASLDDNKDMANTAERTDDRPSRRAWLLKRAEKAAIYSPDKQEVQPASPHAIYRLANKLDMRDLQELAKCAITDQFTVENVLYELVSTFSHQFDEVRESAHEFALEHWEEVKLTSAFKRIATGERMRKIEGASEIWIKLLMGLTSESCVPQKRAAPDS